MLTEVQEESVVKIAINAGTTLLQFWPGRAKIDSGVGLDIQKKSDGSFVTQADFASNDIIITGLKNLFPTDGILSEEIPITQEVLSKNRIWVIDPLDGTKSFVNGVDDFSILISLLNKEHPEFSIMYFPAQGKLCISKKSKGTLLNGEKLSVSKEKFPRKKAINIRGSGFELPGNELIYNDPIDSGLAQLNVASGVFDGVIFKLTSLREWDLAAPTLAIEEAGGKVTDENGNAISFNKGKMLCKYYLASNGLIHEQLLKMIPKE